MSGPFFVGQEVTFTVPGVTDSEGKPVIFTGFSSDGGYPDFLHPETKARTKTPGTAEVVATRPAPSFIEFDDLAG